MKITRYVLGLAAAGLAAAASVAPAQSIEFKGTTSGCFGSSGNLTSATCDNTAPASLDNFLVFTGATFDQWSTNTDPGITNLSNLGAFTLLGLPSDYTNDVFQLAIDFAAPSQVAPDAVFEAVLSGSVTWLNGVVSVNFDSPANFTFNGPQYSGSFNLFVNDLTLSVNGLATSGVVTGQIVSSVTGVSGVTATPEPATLALLGTGFAGLIPMARLRRRKSQDA